MLPDHWEDCLNGLSEAGFITRCPRLPTCGDSRPPKATFQDDVDAVRSAAFDLATAGHPILILAHSWGGHVASEAIREDLYAKNMSSGDSPQKGTIHLMYLSAWLLEVGQSPAQAFFESGLPTPSKMDLGMNEDGSAWVKNPLEALYNDVEIERAEELAKKDVMYHWPEIRVKGTHAAWKDIPTTFVHCTQDASMSLGLQKDMVQNAIESGGSTDITTESCDSGHCPFISMPSEVIRIVEKVWRRY